MVAFSQLHHIPWILNSCRPEERTWERFVRLCGVSEERARMLAFSGGPETLVARRSSLSPSSRKHSSALKGGEEGTPFWKAAGYSLEERYLEGAEILLDWLSGRNEEGEAWISEACVRFILGNLASVEIRASDVHRLSGYMALCIRVQPLAVLYAVEPRLMLVVLLKGRKAARLLMDSHGLGLMNILVEFQSMGFPGSCRYRSLSKNTEQGTGLAGLSGEYRRESALFFGAYHTAIGHPRLALDHFLLLSRESSEEKSSADAVYRPWEALAMGMTGDFDRARALLLQYLRRQRPGKNTAAVRMLQSYLVHAFLDIRDAEGALEHLDSLLAGTGFAVCSIAAEVALARYHAVCGRSRTAWHILQRTLMKANALGYRYVTPMPFFQELLYELHVAGHPDIPGYACEAMLEQNIAGPNLTLRHVALRLRASSMLEQGNLHGAIAVLKKCRAFFVVHGLVFEAAKTIALLACAYLRDHDRRMALRFVIEAWPAFDAHPGLRALWPPELLSLLPAMPTSSPLRTVPLQRQLMRILLELDVSSGHFLQKLLSAFCSVLGASRAGFWTCERGKEPELLGCCGPDTSSLATKERLAAVRQAEENIPQLFVLPGKGRGGRDRDMAMLLPVTHDDDAWSCLYLEGRNWLWSPDDFTEALLAQLKEMVEIPVRRWLTLKGNAGEEARSLPADEKLIFVGSVMGSFLEKVDRVADVDASVLIIGETGVGKELVARRLHRGSRRQGPFIAVNLSSIPEELFESEMLGYERGAFTGANHQKKGILELVDGGTLFFDELPDISPRFQAKLLRLLQERNFMRLGGTRTIHSDFRLVAASNRDMKEEVRQGRFRADLYYRICVISLHVPPLRERREDIPAIARHYLRLYCGRYRRATPELSVEDRKKLCAYEWPGNIRELRNIMAQAAALSTPENLYLALDGLDMPSLPTQHVCETRSAKERSEAQRQENRDVMERTFEEHCSLPDSIPTLEEMERRYIRDVLKMTSGRISGPRGAATLLGINRTTLYKKMKE